MPQNTPIVKRGVATKSVTAALEFLREQAGHSCDAAFAAAGPTIAFMRNIYRWFLLHDTSNTSEYIHQNNPDVRHYDDLEDSRLEWLELTVPIRSLGSNDTLDVRCAMSGLEKLLKTGIAAVNEGSNVLHEQQSGPSNALPAAARTPRDPSELPRGGTAVLKRFKVKTVPAIVPTLHVTATVYMGGYIAPVVREHIDFDYCWQLTSNVPSSQPLQQFTRQQDRGGLLYPSDELLDVLETLRMLASRALQERLNLQRPLTSLLNVAVPALVDSALLKCASLGDDQHRQDLAELVCSRFIKPLLVNYASAATDRSDACKNLTRKPLSRKYLRL
ncbi:hypothetical protein HPB52_010041 [Rhipicephalus sanguineus]|uniref:Uncharacterized protein n=1 Tax=Rhipicephalus sanguineus TaxID=34632 RepID=A0A9D4PVL3_RHISA|nr:hypothetical protein HPB52_010041 [Rhipicephalus sanguineus]